MGKSSILKRYVDDDPPGEHQSTVGVDFKIRTVRKTEPGSDVVRTVKLQIWDTAGQERFRTITRSYYRGAHIVLIVYDITSLESFNSLPMWLSEIEKNSNGSVIKLVVGNKADADDSREVDTDKARQFCSERGLAFFETSALSAQNIEECFDSMLDEYIKKNQKVIGSTAPTKNTASLHKPAAQPAKKGCC